jgi:sugar fermentation stimulation protein A
MKYQDVRPAKFISRPNRFIANIELDGREEVCHVCNTGRCRELLLPGADIVVSPAHNDKRKTKYDLIGVYKEERLINIDSQAPNKIFNEWLHSSNFFPDRRLVKPEYRYGKSRLDFFIAATNRKIFVEVKGVTLETENIALFPDAPTERGIKHINDLCDCVAEGNEAYLFFIIQMKGVRSFSPNDVTHPAFGQALQKASTAGVKIVALDCLVTPDSIVAHDFVEVKL